MKSSRRGFLGLLGGGAVAGPGALKGVIAKVGSEAGASSLNNAVSLSVNDECGGDWRAREILNLLRPAQGPTTFSQHEHIFSDINCLKSISQGFKARMNAEKRREYELAYSVREFIRDKRLNWVGLSEDQLLSIIKKAAGE